MQAGDGGASGRDAALLEGQAAIPRDGRVDVVSGTVAGEILGK
jgi:hypothetical protein